MQPYADGWLADAVSAFGASCKRKLAGPGEREAAIRAPIEALLAATGAELHLDVVPFDEVRDVDRGVRPDYAISVDRAITGYVEVKRPGEPVGPETFHGHNLQQWLRQRDLPNLLYTNGIEWRLWRDGELAAGPVFLQGGALADAGAGLHAPAEFETLLVTFLRWSPAPITTVRNLVQAVAPLTRLLRAEVIDQLDSERSASNRGASLAEQPFIGLASDWRNLLFPTASDAVLADGYAQSVTFALLLARTEQIAVSGVSLHEIGRQLGGHHSLMGRALQILTADVVGPFRVSLDLLARVVGVVDWTRIRAGRPDAYLHLYEHFLDVYDPELRRQSGSYYTPRDVVEQMVRLTEDVLRTRLDKSGFDDPDVVIVDPAMGTGTYLHAILERVADRVEQVEGRGMVPGVVTSLAERLIGFELQMGPYAVAELRTTDLLRELEAELPPSGMRLYVTDTLDDPHADVTQLGSGLELIARSRRRANEVKTKAHVTVVIGNPPYRERAEGLGGWIEAGDPATGVRAPLDAFRAQGNGLAEYVMKNLYVYFWRWATQKVFEDPIEDAGVVCFISTSGYLRGPGFKGMREYLRRTCSEGWIVDVSPEGMRPDVPTRLFPGVQQPLAIGLFYRDRDADRDVPAPIRYIAVHGRRADKNVALHSLTLTGGDWRSARTAWQAPFTPAAEGGWDDHPALNDLMPWVSPGVTPNRTWVYAPSREILDARWRRLISETDDAEKRRLFKESSSATLDRTAEPLPCVDAYRFSGAFRWERGSLPLPVRVGYRSFDRQWLIPDARLLERVRSDLWRARIPGQMFVVEQHSKPISDGPAVIFSELIPDVDHHNNRGGRTLPMLHPNGRPNLANGLVAALSRALDVAVEPTDVVAYIAGVCAHPAFTERFTDELTTPGVRVPITGDAVCWVEAVELGRQIIWAHSYGAVFADGASRPAEDIRYPAGDDARILNQVAVTGMPATLEYEPQQRKLRLGTGEWSPVRPEVFGYTVGGKNVIRSWFNYRKAVPGGKKTSPLDLLHTDRWPVEWSREFTELLTVLSRLVSLGDAQADLLERILAGPLQTAAELAEAGVRWPAIASDRRPDYSAPTSHRAEQLGIDLSSGAPDAWRTVKHFARRQCP